MLFSRVGACRFVYNLALEQRRTWGRDHKLSYDSQQAEITALRAEYGWLKAVPVHALQMAVRALDNAYQRFFVGLAEYPTPRKKFYNDSFTEADPACLGFKRLNKKRGAVKIPKVGWVKFVGFRKLGGRLRSVTISRKSGHWFASVSWERAIPDPAPSDLPSVGVDRGITVFAALSDGAMISPVNAGKAAQDELAKLQQKLARKKKFGQNWKKLKAKITKLHHKIACIRQDFVHKHSSDIAKSHGIVKMEKLQVQNMSASAKGSVEKPGKNVAAKSGLNRSILDQGWGMFRQFVSYKLAERGGRLIEVSAAYTSQTCSDCGVICRKSRKDQSTFVCVSCGHSENADTNAAKNIHQARALAAEPPKRTLRRVGKRKQPTGAVYAL